MAYTKPNTFADGTTLVAADVQGNVDALRVYLHNNVVQADLLASKWVDTRHIQPPTVDAIGGLQHGVTGYQGGQWSGALVNLQFVTSYLNGAGRNSSTSEWRRVPNTSFELDLRRNAKILLHWSVEMEGGPDDAAVRSTRKKSRTTPTAFAARHRTARRDLTRSATVTAVAPVYLQPSAMRARRRPSAFASGRRLTGRRL
jgi:hypothetical protein